MGFTDGTQVLPAPAEPGADHRQPVADASRSPGQRVLAGPGAAQLSIVDGRPPGHRRTDQRDQPDIQDPGPGMEKRTAARRQASRSRPLLATVPAQREAGATSIGTDPRAGAVADFP